MTVRPFAYNPQVGSPAEVIPGTIQYGDIAIGVDNLLYSANPGGVTWFMGPDEDPGWVICAPVPAGDHPTPSGDVGTVRFWRSKTKDDEGFLMIANYVSLKNEFGATFSTVTEAADRLELEGFWTNYVADIPSVFNEIWVDSANWNDTDIWAD